LSIDGQAAVFYGRMLPAAFPEKFIKEKIVDNKDL